MTLRTKPCLVLLTAGAAIVAMALSACQNPGPAANTSTSGTTATHNTPNPPPPATVTTERTGPQ